MSEIDICCEPPWVYDADMHEGHGAAIDYVIVTKTGEIWAGNSEYGTRVNYCPFCGRKAESLVPE